MLLSDLDSKLKMISLSSSFGRSIISVILLKAPKASEIVVTDENICPTGEIAIYINSIKEVRFAIDICPVETR